VAADFCLVFNGPTFECVYDDALADTLRALGPYSVARASYVEPVGTGWTADMAPCGGPLLLDNGNPFRLRADALRAEREWIAQNRGL
jgi:hypothetical protein